MEAISIQLNRLIKESGMSYRELQVLTGIPHSAIHRYSTGTTNNIPISRLDKLARVLGTSAAHLLGWIEPPKGGEKMKTYETTFYFTYGTDGQPFRGGWTVVEDAPNVGVACELFRAYHPDKTKGILNCASIYSEDAFFKTDMPRCGNFGAFEQERITVKRAVNGKEA